MLLSKVTDFATKAHGEQKRKYSGEPYIYHPIAVMQICLQVTDDFYVLAAALLHDVLEDTATTKEEISAFLTDLIGPEIAERTLVIVEELTDEYTKASYPHFNRKQRKTLERIRHMRMSNDAKTVKYADIIHNWKDISVNDPDFARVYRHECYDLLKLIPGGSTELYNEAVSLLEPIKK